MNKITSIIKTNNYQGLTKPYLEPIGLPNFSVLDEIPSFDLYGIMGGTQKITVAIKITKFSSTDNLLGEINSYQINSKFFIEDLFGADWDDINKVKKGFVPGLRSFFWLQHYYGLKPFRTKIEYQQDIYIPQP